MTVKPSRPSIREAAKPGVREQVQTPRPEQPIDRHGNIAAPPISYEELLQYQRDADMKFREWRGVFERVFNLLGSVKDSTQEIEEAKEEIRLLDRSLPKIAKVSKAPQPTTRAATRSKQR